MSNKQPKEIHDLRDRYDFKDCPIHHVPLREDFVPVEFARRSFSMNYYDARNNLFPLANTDDITNDGSDWAHILFCPECRKAKERWMEQERDN